MVMDSVQRHKLKRFVKDLSAFRGRHTELVTVYVPAGYDLNKITTHLSQEQGTATNIKSTATRKNVIDALEKMLQHLKLFKRTPPNGLALFSGNASQKEGQSDVKVWSLEPPIPLNIRIYRCDKAFVMEPLKDMMETEEVYGMIVLDKRDAIIALLKGKAIVTLLKTHSEVPGKFRAGGQSAQRFARQREGAAKDHYKKVAEYAKEQFLFLPKLKGILVGGPGPSKYEFAEGNYITNEVKQKIIAIKDLSYTEEFGLQELLEKCEDVLAEEEVADEKKMMQRFFEMLSIAETKTGYGKLDVENKLAMGAVDVLLLSESLDDEVSEALETKAESMGSKVKIISTDTREGAQLRDMGGIVAILRYPV